MPLGDELSDFRYEFVRNAHYRLRSLNPCFVFENGILLALFFVMRQYSPNPSVIPPVREFRFAHCCFFFLRRRNAARGFPASSYAITTNTLSRSTSGT